MASLRSWLTQNDLHLDPRLELTGPPLHVVATAPIPPHSTLARIPKDTVLSHRTSSLTRSSPAAAASLGTASPPLRLAVHVLLELLLGTQSRWAAYLEHCPTETVPIAFLWDDGGEARRWVRGTQLERELRRLGVSRSSLSAFFHSSVLPLLAPLTTLSSLPSPTIAAFLHAYSLVSSRAFQVDTYHTLALVPLADAFDHSSPPHVHFASDVWVCAECGALDECPHDREDELRPSEPERGGAARGQERQTCEMVATDLPVVPGEEVFNHYGYLSNARLLAEYGFALEANEHDRVVFGSAEVRRARGEEEEERVWEEVQRMTRDDRTEEATSSEPVYVDADAKLSPTLWLLLARSALVSELRSSSNDPGSYSSRIDHLAALLARFASEEEHEDVPLDLDRRDAQALTQIARVVQQLCDTRLRGQHRPELSGAEVLELAEAIEDEQLKRAMEFTAGERLVLERVRENWNAIARLASGI
ncbi:SPOSA6832_00093 [Sporobolomyces salmonicolor]|uniref:SPOSA6832_00093-mRNA-1:cds n=1 Tax=Sporidiobolus salmonicolor TaxID=5005 RepID=A0A0D6EGC8_SPOSA|nr:SPOSA6832_00093 [Sporobolomyces salmonicolor]